MAFDGVLALIQGMSFFVIIVQYGRAAPLMYKYYKGVLIAELKKRNLFGFHEDAPNDAESIESAKGSEKSRGDVELTVLPQPSRNEKGTENTQTEIVVVKAGQMKL